MLKDVLINKSKNYHIHCGRFLTNNIPGLLHREKNIDFGTTWCRIMPRFDDLEDIHGINTEFGYDATALDESHLLRQHAFVPGTVYSTAGLCERFAQYISEFNFFLYMVGAVNSGSLNGDHMIESQDKFDNDELFDLRNNIDPKNVVKYISVGFEADGKMILNITSQFASNFYIQLDPVFAIQIGFPQLIYLIDNLGIITASNQNGVDPLYNLETNFFISNGLISEGRKLVSTGSMFAIDDRYSIDFEITLPLAQTIDILNGKEKHTYILSRFNISDYKKVYCRNVQKQGVMLTRGVFSDSLSLGMTNLVFQAPTAHTGQLMNGIIQEMNIRLLLRYKKYGISTTGDLPFTIEHKQIEMDETGLYDILIQFNKNV
jgi:hypothetical protein